MCALGWLAGTPPALARDTPEQLRDRLIDTYGVANEDDPLVAEARRTLRILLRVLPPPGGSSVDLFVLRDSPEPSARALDARTLVTTHALLAFCCPSGTCDADGRAALALVFGHELAHIVAGDTWQPDDNPTWHDLSPAARDEIRGRFTPGEYERELRADDEGLRALLLAGFSTRAFEDRRGFLGKWARLRPALGKDKPSAETLQERLVAGLRHARTAVEPLHFGVRLLQLGGRRADATLLLEAATLGLPQTSRELRVNRGSAHLEQALFALNACDSRLALRFKLPLAFDPHALVVRTFRGSEVSTCADAPQVRRPLEQALVDFDAVLQRDPGYWPARADQAAARVLQAVLDPGKAAVAVGIDDPLWPAEPPADEALDDGHLARLLRLLAHQGAVLYAWPLPLARRVAWSWLTGWPDPRLQHLAALGRALFFAGPRYDNAAVSAMPLEDLAALWARHCGSLVWDTTSAGTWQNCLALRFNMARLQRERGEAEGARATFEDFLRLEPGGAFADAARRELAREPVEPPLVANLVRPLDQRLPAAWAVAARACKWRTLPESRPPATLAVCAYERLRALRVGKAVELYEWDLGADGPSPTSIVRAHGLPRAFHESPLGRWTWVYADRAYDFEEDGRGQRRATTEVLFTPLRDP